MNEKFCPFLTTTDKKIACQKDSCTFWDEKQKCCEFKKESIISVTDGCRIAFGFTLWAIFLSAVIYLIIQMLLDL